MLRLLSFRLIFRQVRLSRIKYSPNGVGMSWVGRPGLSGLRGAPKGINYNAGGNNTAAASQEVRQCHRSFWKQRRGRVEAVPEGHAEGGGHKLQDVLVLYSMSQSKISTFLVAMEFLAFLLVHYLTPSPPKKSSYAILTRYSGKYCSR